MQEIGFKHKRIGNDRFRISVSYAGRSHDFDWYEAPGVTGRAAPPQQRKVLTFLALTVATSHMPFDTWREDVGVDDTRTARELHAREQKKAEHIRDLFGPDVRDLMRQYCDA
jgi:hypothetical protein